MGGCIGNAEAYGDSIQKRRRRGRYPLRYEILTYHKHQFIDACCQFIIDEQRRIGAAIAISEYRFQQCSPAAFCIQPPQLDGHVGCRAALCCIEHMRSETTCHQPPHFLLMVSLIIPYAGNGSLYTFSLGSVSETATGSRVRFCASKDTSAICGKRSSSRSPILWTRCWIDSLTNSWKTTCTTSRTCSAAA